jgi:hypothetical protein
MNTTKFNAQELCSRKLWQLVDPQANHDINKLELSEAITELARRRRDLEKLRDIIKLDEHDGG